MPSAKDAAYWRAYRERQKPVGPTPVPVERQYVNPPGLHSRYQYLPGDHAVGDMSQQARDRVLARMPVLARMAR
jgi:hypothetical protein